MKLIVFLALLFSLHALHSPHSIAGSLNAPAADKSVVVKSADKKGIVWHDPREMPFRLSGFQWIAQDHVYRRLPLKPHVAIRDAVSVLADNTSGGQIHFQSDSPTIRIRAKITDKSTMYHMPATGQSSFDLYSGAPGALLYNKTARFDTAATEFSFTLFHEQEQDEDEKQMRNFVINFPLYNGVKAVEVGVVAGSRLLPPPALAADGVIVVYGTSITQGASAARPGLSYTNILSRRLNREFVNLGFSGNGRGEPELAQLINQIANKKMIVLDYEANAYEDIRNTLSPFIDILREKNPIVPILIISRILSIGEIRGPKHMKSSVSRAWFQDNLVRSRRLLGDKQLYFLDGKTLLGEYAHEATVDGVHPTSYGFMLMANNIQPVIEEILRQGAAK